MKAIDRSNTFCSDGSCIWYRRHQNIHVESARELNLDRSHVFYQFNLIGW